MTRDYETVNLDLVPEDLLACWGHDVSKKNLKYFFSNNEMYPRSPKKAMGGGSLKTGAQDRASIIKPILEGLITIMTKALTNKEEGREPIGIRKEEKVRRLSLIPGAGIKRSVVEVEEENRDNVINKSELYEVENAVDPAKRNSGMGEARKDGGGGNKKKIKPIKLKEERPSCVF